MNCPYCLSPTKNLSDSYFARFECTRCKGFPRFSDWEEIAKNQDDFLNFYGSNLFTHNMAAGMPVDSFVVDFYFEIDKYCYSISFFPNNNSLFVKMYKKRNTLKYETIKWTSSVCVTPNNILSVVDRLINLKAFL